MKHIVPKFIVLSTLMLVFIMACKSDDIILTCDDYIISLEALETDINHLASTSVCDEDFECRFLPFGVKACGGPKSYVVYSTSIDTLLIANMIDVYNDIEEEFNEICDATSDCSVPAAPIGFDCIDGECIPEF
ncbi:hypothetical protein RM697_04135 [Ichthyenterobacterium sp. W332]|uniref:Lipoprotein n=1 Tax=Microcosmobacter mediterraneus TaxID=3075607 RepID=A0ABU2YJ48_9FLAO|nr:hypothetical protein [Ichthyenterobacterium sp. W332]MDT0557820.1 hypothetical protein [Ichthyenterobacterium sp. W332]